MSLRQSTRILWHTVGITVEAGVGFFWGYLLVGTMAKLIFTPKIVIYSN